MMIKITYTEPRFLSEMGDWKKCHLDIKISPSSRQSVNSETTSNIERTSYDFLPLSSFSAIFATRAFQQQKTITKTTAITAAPAPTMISAVFAAGVFRRSKKLISRSLLGGASLTIKRPSLRISETHVLMLTRRCRIIDENGIPSELPKMSNL